MKLEFHPQRFQVMGRHFFISSQQRTMDCFSNATAQKLQQRMMTVYFPETISTSVPISHPPTLADVTEEKLLKSWANKLWKQLLFSRRFEGAFTHSKTQKRDFSSSCSSAEPVAAARISHLCGTIPSLPQVRGVALQRSVTPSPRYKLLFTPQTQEQETRVNETISSKREPGVLFTDTLSRDVAVVFFGPNGREVIWTLRIKGCCRRLLDRSNDTNHWHKLEAVVRWKSTVAIFFLRFSI